MFKNIKHLIDSISESWEETPWFRAAGILGGTLAGLFALNNSLPSELSMDLSKLDLLARQYILMAIVVLYFLLVSVFSGDRLRFEKKLRELEQNFKYDKKGTLYNGGEPNIAFRIVTFKGILEGISKSMGADTLSEQLIATGRTAGINFANSLGEIYNEDVASHKIQSDWDKLSFVEKLNQWAEYDSSTGWGVLSCTTKESDVYVVITHLHGLFEGDGGKYFGYFLAGYAETIIAQIIKNHTGGGKISDYADAKLVSVEPDGKNKLSLNFKLK